MRALETNNHTVNYMMISKSFEVIVSGWDDKEQENTSENKTQLRITKVWHYDSEREFETYVDWQIHEADKNFYKQLSDYKKERVAETVDKIMPDDDIVIRLAKAKKI